jgi:alpha-L-rhamnosidase
MYRVILGINPDINHPAYKHFYIHPQPGGSIKWAKGSYESINGKISVDWKDSKENFVLEVEIPVNSKATVILPKGSIKMNGKDGVGQIPLSDENVLTLGSGVYSFVVKKTVTAPQNYFPGN